MVNIVLTMHLSSICTWAYPCRLATLISQCLSALLVCLLMMKGNASYQLRLRQLKIHPSILSRSSVSVCPAAYRMRSFRFPTIVQSNINAFGSTAMAGCGAYTKIDGFAILPVTSYSMAITTFTGQNIGAGRFDRVRQGTKVCLTLSLITTLLISLLLFLFGDTALSIFTSDPAVINYGHIMLTLLVPGYFLLAISHAISGVLRGANRASYRNDHRHLLLVRTAHGLILTSVPDLPQHPRRLVGMADQLAGINDHLYPLLSTRALAANGDTRCTIAA
ncbi:MAG: MATE family efflux transporter [Merdibacter sp.]